MVINDSTSTPKPTHLQHLNSISSVALHPRKVYGSMLQVDPSLSHYSSHIGFTLSKTFVKKHRDICFLRYGPGIRTLVNVHNLEAGCRRL